MEVEVSQMKKMKRKSEVEPLERPEGIPPSPLPDLPDDLKMKQETMVRMPTPPKQSKSMSPRGRAHAQGPSVPTSTKPKGKFTYQKKLEMRGNSTRLEFSSLLTLARNEIEEINSIIHVLIKFLIFHVLIKFLIWVFF